MKNKLLKVVYESEAMVAFDKPAGVVVNRAESVKGETVQDVMEEMFPDLKRESDQVFVERSGMVHRLDKETSGVLVFAKTAAAMHALMSQFKERLTVKEYVALVHGVVEPKQGQIRLPLGRLRNQRRFGVVLGGKMSETEYQVSERFLVKNKDYADGFSLLKLLPKTGRTHQLRVVLQHLRHPIVSDWQYLSKKRLKRDLKWCVRVFLHARKLTLTDPASRKLVTIESPIPSDLSEALVWLKEESV